MKKIGNWLGLLVSVAALVWLVKANDFSEMLPHIRTANYAFFLPVPVLLATNFLLRTMRWRLLFGGHHTTSLGNFFSALMIGNLFNNILPARGGEFVKIYLLGKTGGLSKSRILATVIAEKAADLLIAIGLLAFLLATYPVPGWARKAGAVVGAIAFTAVCAIAILGLGGNGIAAACLRAAGFLPTRARTRIEFAMQQFLAGLSGLFSFGRSAYFLLASATIWMLELAIMYAVARAFTIDIFVTDLLFVMLMILFGNMVPSSPGYLGTFEFFGLNALAAIGVTGGGALGFVVVLHAILLLGSSLLGIACLAWQGWPRLQVTPNAEKPGESP